jgi:hypothetical protein
MITRFTLGNFKAFGEAQEMPIRPITLIFGPNSGGKSSIIHGLLLGRRIVETGELDLHQATFEDQVLDLGGFSQYVHQHDLDRHVRWGVETRPNAGASAQEAIAVNIEIADCRDPGAPNDLPNITVSSCEVSPEQRCLVCLKRQTNGTLGPEYVDLQHPLFANLALPEPCGGESLSDAIIRTHGSEEQFLTALSEKLAMTSLHAGTLTASLASKPKGLATLLGGLLFGPVGLLLAPAVAAAISGATGTNKSEASGTEFEPLTYVIEVLQATVANTLQFVLADMLKVQYLGPLRSYPSRNTAVRGERAASWLSDGQHAWDALRNDPSVRAAVNDWLGSSDRLDTPYRLETRRLVDLQTVVNAISKHKDDTDYDALLSSVAAAQGPIRLELVLVDCRTGIELSLRDVGIGVSQVIPVLVNAMSLKEHVIAIEQPEIHLHPALQADLADVFIESALGDQRNIFLLETHSEHLILRIMRRIRESRRGELPQGMPSIGPDDVAILYVEPVGESSVVSLLELDEYGQLIDAWPGGFFEEGFHERFS